MKDDATKWTRRRVVKTGGLALGIGAGANVSGSRSALAHEADCPRTQGFWKNRPDEWPTFPEEASIEVLDLDGNRQIGHPIDDLKGLLIDLLDEPVRGNKYLILAKQYVAARLNRRHAGPFPTENGDEVYDDFWDRVADYNEWMEHAGHPQRDWVVNDIDGEALKDYFEDWNEGVGWPDC